MCHPSGFYVRLTHPLGYTPYPLPPRGRRLRGTELMTGTGV